MLVKLLLFVAIIIVSSLYIVNRTDNNEGGTFSTPIIEQTEEPSQKSDPPAKPLPNIKILENDYHIFQTFNNCGPAALSMTLSYFDINESQQTLGQALRPYQVANGDNDDKSVTLAELATKAQEYGLVSFHRPNGTEELVKQFIANDIPVITRTWLKPDEDIGHFRVIKGYDDNTGEFIQDDSLQGKSLRYSYSDFDVIWKKFNYEYLVLVREGDIELVKKVLVESYDEKDAWKIAETNANKKLLANQEDHYARFNLAVAYYHLGNFQGSVMEYEKVAPKLSKRTLWYQIEPIKAYFELGNYEKVFSITENILNNGNRAFSELYLLRGDSYMKQGNKDLAKAEYEKAVYYNKNLKEAKEKLNLVAVD